MPLLLYALELAGKNALFPANTHPDVKLYGNKMIRTCEKFDACTSKSVKTRIVESFTKPDGAVRIVISTVAFAMGIDVPNIHTVIHWGPPNDVESYVQETGRGGRDGKATNATLYYNKRDIVKSGHVQESMRMYCMNVVQCRRQQLMKQFCEVDRIDTPEFMHMCCDLCAGKCKCPLCTVNVSLSEKDVEQFEYCSDSDMEYQDVCTLSRTKSKKLQEKLLQLRQDIVISEPAAILVGPEI